MKIFLLFLSIFLISGITSQSYSLNIDDEDILVSDTSVVKIMPLGDSITFGINPDDENSPGYRRALDSLLRGSGINFDFVGNLSSGEPDDFDRDNDGHLGWRARSDDNISKSLYHNLLNFLEVNNPHIILLHIGTNDISSALEIKTASQIASAVTDLLDIIYNFNPEIITVVAKIIDRADNSLRHQKTINFNDTLGIKIDSLKLFRDQEIFIVDMFNALGSYYDNLNNINFTYQENSTLHTLHPNNNGYSVMAHSWHSALMNILPPLRVDDETTFENFVLYQNYPNPFNSSTTIKFSVPEKGRVKISIFNILGQLLKTSLDDEVQAGLNYINFNTENLPSGTYLYRIQMDNYAETKKMLLLK